jgi:hypothetical protein
LHIFLDESGDLGFGKGSSRYFVIALLLTPEGDALKRIAKRTRHRRLAKKHQKLPELKATKVNSVIREYVLRQLASADASVMYVVLDKGKVYDYLKSKKNKLYNYVAGLVLNEAQIKGDEINLVIDKFSQNMAIRRDFDQYVTKKSQMRLPIPRENEGQDKPF